MSLHDEHAKRMLEAIHVINSGTFTAGAMPSDNAPPDVVQAYVMTRREGTSRLKLRSYQRAGISSRSVAAAIELGVLTVEIAEVKP